MILLSENSKYMYINITTLHYYGLGDIISLANLSHPSLSSQKFLSNKMMLKKIGQDKLQTFNFSTFSSEN